MAWAELGAAAIGGLGSILGGAMSQSGANERNQQQIQAAREQMAFQERMSNTAYQRSMADMRAAGLNPILAYQKGGASSPGGAMPNIENTASGWGPAMAGAASSAMGAARTVADVKATHEDTTKKVTEQDLNRVNTELSKSMEAKARQDTITSAAQARLNDNSAAYQQESAINAAVQNQILQHQVTSAAGEARIKTREAEDTEKYGASKLGQTIGATIRQGKTLLDNILSTGNGTSVPTPVVPSPKNDSWLEKERNRKIGEPR